MIATPEHDTLDARQYVRKLYVEHFAERNEDERANDGAPYGPNAAEQGHDERARRHEEAKHRLGRNNKLHDRVDATRSGGERRG